MVDKTKTHKCGDHWELNTDKTVDSFSNMDLGISIRTEFKDKQYSI